jgi:2-polyprenyl-6-methoxyphenol hydroxylase-like FAD-dependent oxidoreductase
MTRTHNERKTAMVIGCGIGGPVVAMALQKIGIDATVFEAHDGSAEFVGSFLNTASNGLDALKAIDASNDVLERGFPTPRMVMWSGSGKRLGEVANGLRLRDGTVSITVERGHLHGALRRQALQRGIKIEQGRKLVSAESSGGGVIARFADGTDARGDLLIGADGIHSRVRQLVDPAAPAPRYTGQLSLGGRARGTMVPPTPETFHMIFGRRAFFGYSVLEQGDVYWFANMGWADEPSRESISSRSAAEWKSQLANLFAEDAGPACEIISATTDEIAAFPIYDMPVVPRWHREGMVILGDAAHATSPSSGQGASLAIEDAIVLAKCLRDCDDVSPAFATYERLRRPRVERVVAYSARLGQSKTAGPVGRWIRDLVMPLALRLFANPSAHAWLYAYHIDWSERVA